MNLRNKYQSAYQIANSVQNQQDVETLRQYIADNDKPALDEDMTYHLAACKEALRFYEQDLFKLWSTPFLQFKAQECRTQADVLQKDLGDDEERQKRVELRRLVGRAEVFEAEVQSRGGMIGRKAKQ